VGVVGRQWLVEDPRGVPVLRADGEPRVEDRRRLPHEDLERSAASAFGRRERGLRRGGHDADAGQHLAGKWGRNSERKHPLDEPPSRDTSVCDVVQGGAEVVLVHALASSWERMGSERRRLILARYLDTCAGRRQWWDRETYVWCP